MPDVFWFNRMVEYWSIPLRLDLGDLVRRARIQMVQAGTFGPQFYSLADDPAVDRRWVGMPLVGIRENLTLARERIAEIQAAGARFIGQMSMSWHYGDHEIGKGLFSVWETLWTDDLLGTMPCPDPALAQERLADGALRCWPIEGRPYRTYAGCISNPHWVATLKPMVKKAIELGVDGLMVHHNFTTFCKCGYCRDYGLTRFLREFDAADLRSLFGTDAPDGIQDVFTFHAGCPEALKQRAERAVQRWTHERRKTVFDEIFTGYGRSLKPDLMLAQWYHKYNFKPSDERSLLPGGLWAKDEDYIWYSQGSHKGISVVERGYLADMGLPARFVYAAGGGRPFVINKYDYRRFRLSIAEAGANHAAALAYHWAPQEEETYHLEDYMGPLIRYHRFLADHDDLIHPAAPWSQAALVYPRRAETAGDGVASDALKRLGRLLEDEHVLFDILLDEHLMERTAGYQALILPDIRRMTRDEALRVRRFATEGGTVVLTEETGIWQPDGRPHDKPLFADWQTPPKRAWGAVVPAGAGRAFFIPDTSWQPAQIEARPGLTLPLYPLREHDRYGQVFLKKLQRLLGGWTLRTDAPWYVRVRAWRPERRDALTLHWVNYRQDEVSAIEVPIPTGPIQADCRIPAGFAVDRVEWRYPEMREPVVLPHRIRGDRVRFTVPGVIVYGLSVVYLRRA